MLNDTHLWLDYFIFTLDMKMCRKERAWSINIYLYNSSSPLPIPSIVICLEKKEKRVEMRNEKKG